MGEFEAKRCRGKAVECFNLPAWGSLLPLLLQGSLQGRFPGTTKVCCCLLAGDVPPAFPVSLPICLLSAAGCMQLNCINRPTFPAVSAGIEPMGAPAGDEREQDGETRVLVPLAPLGEGLTELHPAPIRRPPPWASQSVHFILVPLPLASSDIVKEEYLTSP